MEAHVPNWLKYAYIHEEQRLWRCSFVYTTTYFG